jgi:hypothetical protein
MDLSAAKATAVSVCAITTPTGDWTLHGTHALLDQLDNRLQTLPVLLPKGADEFRSLTKTCTKDSPCTYST